MDETLHEDAHAVQARLPLDLDAPIPFELTARARRLVAPTSLPALEVVPGPDEDVGGDGFDVLEDPADTRPARARALRRAGMSIDGIAAELDLEAFVVSALVDDIAPVASARRRLRSVDGGRVARRSADLEEAARVERVRQQFEGRRRQARDEVAQPLTETDDFVRGLGLVVGTARIVPHAILVTVRDRDVAAAISTWIGRHLLDEATRMRVILRVAPQLSGDVERHAWADSLGVPVERITLTRWRNAPEADSVEATIRVADAEAAGRLAGWRDAALGSFATGGSQ